MVDTQYRLFHGDNREVLKTYPDNHFDSIVCDPPYELGFMGKAWDSTGIAYDVAMWRECWRVLKHGGHLLAFGGSRTYHRMACAIEDAGFEIRDQIMWVYGSGFPKSLNVGKAIDREAGAEREVVGAKSKSTSNSMDSPAKQREQGYRPSWKNERLEQATVSWDITAPATAAAEQWDGWGTALKPAHEPIVVARKPLSEGTVAANVLKWGTGAINVDGCRVDGEPWKRSTESMQDIRGNAYNSAGDKRTYRPPQEMPTNGRWPANLILDGSEEVVAGFPETTSGSRLSGQGGNGNRGAVSFRNGINANNFNGDTGSAARFFYCAKASKEDRDEGCEALEERMTVRYNEKAQGPLPQQTPSKPVPQRNHHATVKPTELMRYLCRLVTPPSGIVLDPFAGSGSTGKGAILEGFYFVGIELEADHVAIAHARLEFAAAKRAEAEVLERNAAGDYRPTAKEEARGMKALFW